MPLASIVAQKSGGPVVEKKHSPTRATLYSTALPGLGQIYNKKYWKPPIIYAGFGVTLYFAINNGKNYNDYRKAYDYKMGTNPNVGQDIIDIAQKYSANDLVSLRDDYRRNMELSWILFAAWYGLQILDAAVDAHFFYYDISDDLTLKIEPMVEPASYNTAYGGFQTGLSFKLQIN